ncbi:hypothetical protein ACLKA6_006307 [Drosophila palustris]
MHFDQPVARVLGQWPVLPGVSTAAALVTALNRATFQVATVSLELELVLELEHWQEVVLQTEDICLADVVVVVVVALLDVAATAGRRTQFPARSAQLELSSSSIRCAITKTIIIWTLLILCVQALALALALARSRSSSGTAEAFADPEATAVTSGINSDSQQATANGQKLPLSLSVCLSVVA